jgi:hypothetical protein
MKRFVPRFEGSYPGLEFCKRVETVIFLWAGYKPDKCIEVRKG